MTDRSLNVWIIQAGAVLDWISAQSVPFDAPDLAGAIDVCPRSAYRILKSATLCGWVRRECIRPNKVVYHPLVRVGVR